MTCALVSAAPLPNFAPLLLPFVSPPSPSSPVLFLPLLAVLEECVRAAQKNKSLTGGGGGGRERKRGFQSCVRGRREGKEEGTEGKEGMRGAGHGSAGLNIERRFVTARCHAASHTFLSSSSKPPPHTHSLWSPNEQPHRDAGRRCCGATASFGGLRCASCSVMVILSEDEFARRWTAPIVRFVRAQVAS